ncbi:MAG: hypothetical protein ABI679_04330 [Gemmatimonadota bacterium]
MRVSWWSVALVATLSSSMMGAQQVSVDRGLRVANLWCFPLASDSTVYVYIPAVARMARDGAGLPQFSLLQYAVPTRDTSSGLGPITSTSGGGVFHFLVEYATSPDSVARAGLALREITHDTSVRIRGPLVFNQARYTLVSSVLQNGKAQVLATGRAPVMEGNRLALSFALEPEQATLLARSLEQSTSDVSLAFDLDFSGLTDAYEAELDVDWAAVQHSFKWSAGGNIYFIGVEVENKFDELVRTGGLRLKTAGNDPATEALVQVAYQRLLEVMFSPVEPDEVPAEDRGGMMTALSQTMKSGSMGGGMSAFGVHAGYRLAELKQSGHSTLSFNHRATVTRQAMLVFNAGSLLRQFGSDPRFVRSVSIDDPLYRERDVYVGVDGELLPEFSRAINSVTVTLRKKHQSGVESVDQVLLDAAAFRGSADPRPRLAYGYDADSNRLAWLGYEWRARWHFVGGAVLETPWQQSDAAMINLHTPYTRRRVELTGDIGTLQQRGVRAVIVQLTWPFFGEARLEQKVLRPATPPTEPIAFEVTLPRDSLSYGYTITWQFDGRRVSRHGHDDVGLVFVDEIPPDTAPVVTPVTDRSTPDSNRR